MAVNLKAESIVEAMESIANADKTLDEKNAHLVEIQDTINLAHSSKGNALIELGADTVAIWGTKRADALPLNERLKPLVVHGVYYMWRMPATEREFREQVPRSAAYDNTYSDKDVDELVSQLKIISNGAWPYIVEE